MLPILILAGGLGTRLGSLQKDRPKSMVEVAGKPFVHHQLQLLKRQGAKDVVLCVGYRQQALCDFVGDGSKFGLNVTYSSDGESPLGTGGAALKASALVGPAFAVLYGDSYLDVPLAPMVQTFEDCGKPALMTVYHNRNQGEPSNLLVRDGSVIAYNKENPTTEMEYIDFGFSIYSRIVFEEFSLTSAFDLDKPIKALIARGQLACHEVFVPFHEIGSLDGLEETERYMRSSRKNISQS